MLNDLVKIFLIIFVINKIVECNEYDIKLITNGPVVIGSTIHFFGELYTNGEKKLGEYRYEWKLESYSRHRHEHEWSVSFFFFNRYSTQLSVMIIFV